MLNVVIANLRRSLDISAAQFGFCKGFKLFIETFGLDIILRSEFHTLNAKWILNYEDVGNISGFVDSKCVFRDMGDNFK